jgi:hypothetical protein
MSSDICNIVSDLQKAQSCGLCDGTPNNCGELDPSVCLIPQNANLDMHLFATRYSPTGALDQSITTKTEQAYMGTKAQNLLLLKSAYPNVTELDINWPEMERCGIARMDAYGLGMSPAWPIGGKTLLGKIWNPDNHNGNQAPIPLFVDYFMNPDMFILIIVLIFVVLILVGVKKYGPSIYHYLTSEAH